MSVSIDVTVQEGEGSSDPAVDLAVFLCRKCKLPLGDTGDWVEKAENGDILLSAVTENVKIDVNKAVSSFIHDAYSTVQTLQCKGCKSIVGALYIATPEHLDYKRDLFILNTSVLNCANNCLAHAKERSQKWKRSYSNLLRTHRNAMCSQVRVLLSRDRKEEQKCLCWPFKGRSGSAVVAAGE
ncbi:protein Mis18-alpha-like isoform X1 [Hyla sarda]|uniref:protein Mis18-alpha-like isoform X1 n=1 Tax=Hyla sarda TaxID=327740 RepID=UPI0024C4163B|nr:protein Mis18-alpha-like isoform X1 [Hyla sarda]